MKQRTTLWDFMTQHPSLVEDLRIASEALKGKPISLHLSRYADELKEFDPIFCKEWHDPFSEPDMWVLEYNESNGLFHYNSSYKDGHFAQHLFTNGWSPICVIPDCYSLDAEFIDLLNRISKSKLQFTLRYQF